MICSTCGSENDADARFCDACGTSLAAGCPSCGTSNKPGARFCRSCGTALAGSGPPLAAPAAPPVLAAAVGPASAAAPVAERRLVSVLFADLVGFTPFAEERDAEDVRDTLTRYFDLASDVITRYGGTVEKFIGDAVMAVWGAPVAREDDAERAVRAALDLVDAVRTLGPGIQARAGVLTGEAAVTIGATNQGMVAGDLVNTAARLQGVAQPGTVLVGEATHRAASSAIAFEPAGEQALKGKQAPVEAWRALRVVAQRGGQGRSDLPEPPFVGRDEELRLLKDSIGATGRERRARLVSITGPGGIGKSRLAWELEKYIDGISETIWWHRGRSPSYGEGITFWALGEMVRRRAGLAETDDEATTRARIAATVVEYVPTDEDRRWVEPALLTLLGLEPAPAGGRDVLFAAWRILFERIAERGTTVLLFEDLQWADTGLLDFIEHLLEWSKNAPILVVTLARPELMDRRPDWGAATRNLTKLAVQPLSDGAMRELLAGFVPGLPETAVATILGRAEGMPLYAVETVRMLVAEGRLVLVDGVYRPAGDLGELAVPETLRSLIASRLDALDPTDRSLVADASVLGQTFTLVGLAAVSGQPSDALEARLRTLVRRELFDLELDPRSPERGQYRFVQSLIREVAHSTLARPERRARHLAAARFYESLGEDELAGALASHYLAAHEASAPGPEADAVAIQARIALRAAAERAVSLGANDQAVTYLAQALEVTAEPAERAELELRAATAADRAADHDRAETYARAAVADFRSIGDADAVARATAELGVVLLDGAQPGPAVEALETALAELSSDASDEVRARLLVSLTRAQYRNDDPERALVAVEQALPIIERLGLEDLVADAFNNKSAALGYLGRRREATALMSAAIDAAAATGSVAAELRARSNLASTIWSIEPRRALEMQRTNLELARRVGNRQMADWILGSVAGGSWQAGLDWQAALAQLDDALASVRSTAEEAGLLGSRLLLAVPRGEPVDDAIDRLGELAATASDPSVVASWNYAVGDRALIAGDDVEAYERMIKATDFRPLAAIYLDIAMRPALWLGDLDRARSTADRLDAVPDAGTPQVTAARATARAGIAALEGRREAAVRGYLEAFGLLRELGADLLLALAVIDAVRLLGPDVRELAAIVPEARSIFQRVGAVGYLARLDEAIGGDMAGRRDSRPRAGDTVTEVSRPTGR